MNQYLADTHTYMIDGRIVPSVTQVLGDLLPGYHASEWHMQRGTAMHACAAMIAQGVEFSHDPQLDGRVASLRAFFRDVRPKVMAVEQQLYSQAFLYAGTCDMVCEIDGRKMVVDWKSTIAPAAKWQLAAYAQILGLAYGCAIEIRDDGSYRMSEIWNLTRVKNQWLSLLAAYNIRRECGIKPGEQIHE